MEISLDDFPILDVGDALVIIDYQQDFLEPDGIIPIPGSREILPNIQILITEFLDCESTIIYTRKWYKPEHFSFKENKGVYPTHCVQLTQGAMFAPEISAPLADPARHHIYVVSKGKEIDIAQQSPFDFSKDDNEYMKLKAESLFEHILIEENIKRLFICGITTDYDIRAIVFGALDRGYEVVLVLDATTGLSNETMERTLTELEIHGAEVI